MMHLSEKIEKIVKEVEIFIQYGVQESEQQDALKFLHRYKNDTLALQLMRTFYTSLPETHEESIARITLIQKKDDIFLLGLTTARHSYLYLATEQKALLLGEYGCEIVEPEALAFFGYPDTKVFFEKYPGLMSCEEYESVGVTGARFCPVCASAVGEYHLLGCPVEVCPWCDGQFTRCSCRFEKLGVEILEDEEELEELERILEEKGRVPYSKEQCPSYPSGTDE
ncbi:MAG: hypothetical protein KJ990_08835 [Proteobacteria bacterium]|nr:hypothetical protein [Pseudomonadota bacterium]MBU1650522.1 hypothetical protein [Pseudomonadota bacterium]